MTKVERIEQALEMLRGYRGQAAAISGVLQEAARTCPVGGLEDTTVTGFGYLLERLEREIALEKRKLASPNCCPHCAGEGRVPLVDGTSDTRRCEPCLGRGVMAEWEAEDARRQLSGEKKNTP